MTKGRKKIPNELKTMRGTDKPCRMTEQTGLTHIVTIPRAGLKGTAKKVFELVATELIHKNILEAVGLDLVVAYAREMALYHDSMREIEKEGFTIEIETKKGTMTIINPKRKIAESALANAKALASEFGLTPASRSRISGAIAPEAPKDDFAEFEEVNDNE